MATGKVVKTIAASRILRGGRSHTSVLTDALGGGSHTAVKPAAFISAALLASMPYQAGSLRCEHSQLKPCAQLDY